MFTCGYLFGEGLLESGDLDGAEVEFEKAASIPSVLIGWAPVTFAASRAIAAGRLDEADELVERAHQLGAALGETNDVITWGNRFMVEMARARDDDRSRWSSASSTRCSVPRSVGACLRSGDLVINPAQWRSMPIGSVK